MVKITPAISAVFEALLADGRIQKALAFVDADHENKCAELKEMTLLHGAPFKEREVRSPMFKSKLEQYGATDCFIDAHDNAFGYIRGGDGPLIVIEGHLDTVFDEGTPLAITEKDGVRHCPGIADDTAGLANILSCLRAIRHAGLVPAGTILAQARAITHMGNVRLPREPQTSYTVGLVSGGTSVNSIAYEARMKLDMRSVSPEALMDVEKTMLALAEKGAAEETAFWEGSGDTVTVEKLLIGDRPAGKQADNAPLVQALAAAITTQGCTPNLLKPISTNANAPLSRGIPGIILRPGGKCGGLHSLKEWFAPNGSQNGVKAAILLLFALAGLPSVCDPVTLQ